MSRAKKKACSGWRYAVIRHTRRVFGKTVHEYKIHEVYDTDARPGFFSSWTQDSIMPSSDDSLDDLRWSLSMMLADSFSMPVYEIRKGKLVPRSVKK